MSIKRFIAVSGPSESGKSGGVIYLLRHFPETLCHIKIRNVFAELYEQSGSNVSFDEWREKRSKDRIALWQEFVGNVEHQVPEGVTVLMDTMYGIEDLQALFQVLGERLVLLYIDAPELARAEREHLRLGTDSPYSSRKADVTVTLEQVTERMREKDAKKRSQGVFDYPLIHLRDDGGLHVGGEGREFTVVINNDSTEEEFHRKLEMFVESLG